MYTTLRQREWEAIRKKLSRPPVHVEVSSIVPLSQLKTSSFLYLLCYRDGNCCEDHVGAVLEHDVCPNCPATSVLQTSDNQEYGLTEFLDILKISLILKFGSRLGSREGSAIEAFTVYEPDK